MAEIEKPSQDEVEKYAEKQIDLLIFSLAGSVPAEQKDEMRQNARIRVWRAYKNLDASRGWKSFIQLHCRGAILDYIRWGEGFEESELEKDAETKAKRKAEAAAFEQEAAGDDEEIKLPAGDDPKPWRLKKRITPEMFGHSVDKDPHTFEEILGRLGVTDETADPLAEKPNWDLIARLASQDQDVHILAKMYLGFTHDEISKIWRVSRERITQRLTDFCDRLDSPEHRGSRWIAQVIYAFGLCDQFHQPRKDLGFGYEYDPVDLYSEDINYLESINPQQTFEFVYQ